MWKLPDDHTAPVITAQAHIRSAHRGGGFRLPPTAVVFFMGGGTDHLAGKPGAEKLPDLFPSFLNRRPIWHFRDLPVCFLNGGAGAPQAADTVETLAALGVERIVAVGMFGAFSPLVRQGGVLLPEKAWVEEGTSLHYWERIESASPDPGLHRRIAALLGPDTYPVVSTDAVYRQTFRKEQLWREKGAVGVDMETSAVFSVSRYLGLRSAALLMASDLHPMTPDAPKWIWTMTGEKRAALAELGFAAAKEIAE